MALSYSLIFAALACTAVLAHPGGGRHGGHGGPGGFQPPFLQNVTNEGRQAFFAIVTNFTLTIAETESQINAWAQTYGVSDQVTAFGAQIEAKLNEIKQNVTATVNNLPSVLSQLETILDNKQQTLAQQAQAIEALKEQFPQEVGVLFFLAVPKGRKGFGGFPGDQGGNQGGFPGFGGNQGGFPGGQGGQQFGGFPGQGGNQGGFPGFGGQQGGQQVGGNFGGNQGGRGRF